MSTITDPTSDAALEAAARRERHRAEFMLAAFGTDVHGKPIEGFVSKTSLPSNSQILTPEDYDHYIFILRHWDTGHDKLDMMNFRRHHGRKGYRIASRYKVLEANVPAEGEEPKFQLLGLHKKQHESNDQGKWLVHLCTTDMFDAICDAHESVGHGRIKKTHNAVKDKYGNITEVIVTTFLSTCPQCATKSETLRARKEETKLSTPGFRECFQVS